MCASWQHVYRRSQEILRKFFLHPGGPYSKIPQNFLKTSNFPKQKTNPKLTINLFQVKLPNLTKSIHKIHQTVQKNIIAYHKTMIQWKSLPKSLWFPKLFPKFSTSPRPCSNASAHSSSCWAVAMGSGSCTQTVEPGSSEVLSASKTGSSNPQFYPLVFFFT